jgi:hypothetical protein
MCSKSGGRFRGRHCASFIKLQADEGVYFFTIAPKWRLDEFCPNQTQPELMYPNVESDQSMMMQVPGRMEFSTRPRFPP